MLEGPKLPLGSGTFVAFLYETTQVVPSSNGASARARELKGQCWSPEMEYFASSK